MNPDNLTRKHAVLIYADVTDSAELLKRDQGLSRQRMREAFHGFAEMISIYTGTVRAYRGDSLVADFERPSHAVAAALSFQRRNHLRNELLEGYIRPHFRIGISLGNLVISDGTITGPGVVIAQRLGRLAEVDGIVVQDNVYDAIPNRLPFDFDNLGEQRFPGVDQTLRAFSVRIDPAQPIPGPETIILSKPELPE